MLFVAFKRPGGVLFVKNIKGRKADIGNFFLMETRRDFRIGVLLRNVRRWPACRRGRSARHR
jgi:hypothetical protein